MAAILDFPFLTRNHKRDVLVPGIFGISIPKNPYMQMFMLSSQSARQHHISAPLIATNLNLI